MKQAPHKDLRFCFVFMAVLIAVFLQSSEAEAQQNIRDSTISFPMIGATGAFQIPGGDISDRFGNNFNVGGVFQWKTKKNLLYGLDGQFIFGNTVKENNIFDSITTSQGGIISSQGDFADVVLYERGFKFELKLGKIFPVLGPNKNSGLLATAGVGLLQHKIRIENTGTSVPSIEGDYKKGYDRLSNGACVTAFAGYINFGNQRLVNFYAGLEATAAFTQNRRSFNFDTREQDVKNRKDYFWGFRFGWIIPIYKRVPNTYYYN